MSAEDFILRYRDSLGSSCVPSKEFWAVADIIRDAWFAGHKQGLKDFREGLEAQMKAQGEKA